MFDAGAIVARMDLDLQGWKKSINEVKADTHSVRGLIMRNEHEIRRLGVSLGIVGAGMTLVLRNWAKSAIDAVESENLFTVAMGRMEGAARAWSNTYSRAVGANSYETRKMVGTFHLMLTAMGIIEERSLTMSQKLTELANDMASLYNMSVEDAFIKLQAGLSGEIEPLKRLGIVLKEEVLAEYAAAEGITAHWKEANEATKVYARYRFILEQTKAAQGDLLRTQDSQANQIRRIQNQYEEFKIEIMTGLMPVFGEMLGAVDDITDGLLDWAKANPELASSIGLVTVAVTGLMTVLAPFLIALPTLAKLPWAGIAKVAGYAALLSMKGNASADVPVNIEAVQRRLNELDRIARFLESQLPTIEGVGQPFAPQHAPFGAPMEPVAAHAREVTSMTREKLRLINQERELLRTVLAEHTPADTARAVAQAQSDMADDLSDVIRRTREKTKTTSDRSYLDDLIPYPNIQPEPWEEVRRVINDAIREQEEWNEQIRENWDIELAETAIRVAEIDAEVAESRKDAWTKAFEEFERTDVVTRYRRFMWDVTGGWENAIGTFLDDFVHDFDLSLTQISGLFDAFFESILRAWINMAATMAAESMFEVAAPEFRKIFRFASGGRVDRPTLALIGDDPRGPERVLSGPENAAYERGLGRAARVSVEIHNETGVPMTADATVSQADTENLVIGIVAKRIGHDRAFRDLVRGGR